MLPGAGAGPRHRRPPAAGARARWATACARWACGSSPCRGPLAAAHLLALGGLLPRPAAGAPPIPADARFGALAGLAIILAPPPGSWAGDARPPARPGACGASRAAEGAAALGAPRSLLVLLIWIAQPLRAGARRPGRPRGAAGHLGARRPWHLPALGGPRADPAVVTGVQHVAGILHSNAPFAVWYLFDTSANGSRGATGVLLALLIAACVWVDRARSWSSRPSRAALARPARPARRPERPPPASPCARPPPGADAGRW